MRSVMLQMDALAQRLETADRLNEILRRIGFALWQIQGNWNQRKMQSLNKRSLYSKKSVNSLNALQRRTELPDDRSWTAS